MSLGQFACDRRDGAQLNEQIHGSAVFLMQMPRAYRLYFFDSGSQWKLGLVGCGVARSIVRLQKQSWRTRTGIPVVSMIAPAEESLPILAYSSSHTPKQQHVEEWLKVKIQFPMFNQQRGILKVADPAGLPETGNGIGDSGSSKLK